MFSSAEMARTPTMNAPPRRIRILHCITHLGLGGSERVAFTLMHALHREIDFGLFTVSDRSEDEVGAGMQRELESLQIPWFKGTALPMKRGGMLPGGLALRHAVLQMKPDLIHHHSEISESCGATMNLLSPQAARIPVLRTVHNSVFWRYWPRIGSWCDHRLRHAHIACVSQAARDEFDRYRKQSGAGQPPEPPRVIYNGVALPTRAPHAQPHRAGVRRVLFAGRFEPQKGTDILCAALPLVPLEARIRCELTLHGSGAHAAALNQLAANPPPGWTVWVQPPVADLVQRLPNFDLLIMPSRFEGLSLMAIEAIQCGLPVVATKAPGLAEVFPPHYPWLARPEDAADFAQCLSRALRDPATWQPAVTQAQAFAAEWFTPEKMSQGYRELYQSFAGKT